MLGLVLLAPTSSATAVGETCRGEAATIIGTGPALIGTEERDVIVTGPATEVSALGGDDLICVTGTAGPYVSAGSGNDTVDTTVLGSATHLTVYLGAGADTLVGGAAAETVTTGEATYAGVDNDTDSVSTGAGDDRVVVGTQWPPNTDRPTDAVDLGPGDDVATIQSRTMLAASSIEGGEGTDQIAVDFTNDGASSVDMARGIVQAGEGTYAKPVSLISFETAEISTTWPGGSGASGPASVDYTGTSGDDVVTLRLDRTSSNPDVSVQTFGGDDLVLFTDTPTSDTRVDTGAGEDQLVAAGPNGSMRLDLARGVWRSARFYGPDPVYWGATPEVVISAVDRVEDVFLMAPELTLVGDGKANHLSFNGCRGTLRGGAGGDRLSAVAGDPWWETFSYDCEALSLEATSTMAGGPGQDRVRGGGGVDRLRGDGGNDVIQGRGGNDVLLGGRGKDEANGGKGRDRCVAEVRKRCER
jgi:Ca2+-binding RTX toxin-like protein